MEEKIYHNKFAHLYDYFQNGVKGDVEFYLNYFKNFTGKILEVGAGTGRITIPLLKRSLNVTALDVAPEMLQILKEKSKKQKLSVKIVCADMRKFKLRDKFDAIIITFRAFQHMYSVDDQLNALKSMKKYLKPDGILIFDVYTSSFKYIQKGDWQWHKDQNIKLPRVKGIVKIDYRNRYDMAEQIMYQEYRFNYPNGRKQLIPLQMRFFFRFELEHLLSLAGFEIKNLYGDFKKNKFKNGSPEMIWVAKPYKI
ncbi:MAG: class I SAM-dependent methyltransferase [Patescibacteria group bacterium]|jgi:SAM-dependent methyltransferase